MKITVMDLDKYAASLVTSVLAQSVVEEKTDASAETQQQTTESTESSSSSSSEKEPPAIHLDELEWFAQPGAAARVHLQRNLTPDGRRMAACRKAAPFKLRPRETGTGIASLIKFSARVCDACLGSIPHEQKSTVIRALENAAKGIRNEEAGEAASEHRPEHEECPEDYLLEPSPYKWWN